MKAPGKSGGPSPIIFQKSPGHGHVLEDHGSRDGIACSLFMASILRGHPLGVTS